MICPKCGLQSKEGDRFCQVCGTALMNVQSDFIPQDNPNMGYNAPQNDSWNQPYGYKQKGRSKINEPYIIKSELAKSRIVLLILSIIFILGGIALFIYAIFDDELMFLIAGPLFGIGTPMLLVCIGASRELYITENNVIGKTPFGDEIKMPLHTITTFTTSKFLSSIAVSSSSGVAKFSFIANYREIGNVLSQNMAGNQKSINNTVVATTPPQNSIEDLLKLKSYLDLGIITQEEFEAKKRQMLGL